MESPIWGKKDVIEPVSQQIRPTKIKQQALSSEVNLESMWVNSPPLGVDSRLLVLEAKTQSESRPRLSVLVLRGPDELAELANARTCGFLAELDTPEDNARFLG